MALEVVDLTTSDTEDESPPLQLCIICNTYSLRGLSTEDMTAHILACEATANRGGPSLLDGGASAAVGGAEKRRPAPAAAPAAKRQATSAGPISPQVDATWRQLKPKAPKKPAPPPPRPEFACIPTDVLSRARQKFRFLELSGELQRQRKTIRELRITCHDGRGRVMDPRCADTEGLDRRAIGRDPRARIMADRLLCTQQGRLDLAHAARAVPDQVRGAARRPGG
jgi:hypothetical protein